MNIFDKLNPFNWFKKEQEEIEFPRKYGIIHSTNQAQLNNIKDNWNKKITIFENGRPTRTIDYTEEDAVNILNILEIPIKEEKLSEDFEFLEEKGFGDI